MKHSTALVWLGVAYFLAGSIGFYLQPGPQAWAPAVYLILGGAYISWVAWVLRNQERAKVESDQRRAEREKRHDDRMRQADLRAELDQTYGQVSLRKVPNTGTQVAGKTLSVAQLIEAIEALIALDDAKALVPHGIGGHSRALLQRSALKLAELNAELQETRNDSARLEWCIQNTELVYSDEAGIAMLGTTRWNEQVWFNGATAREAIDHIIRDGEDVYENGTPYQQQADAQEMSRDRFIAEYGFPPEDVK